MITDAMLREGAARLSEASIPYPLREARLIARNVGEDPQLFDARILRRAQREPISHILGYRDFYEHRFIVTPDVLDPRPDTETLVIAALEEPFKKVLDLGTGSGCILLSLLAATQKTLGVGTDVSEAALLVAQQNQTQMGLNGRASFVQSDWFSDVADRFDLIVSNPPYIAQEEMADLQPEVRLHEPRGALTDEADGLSAYRVIVSGAHSHLTTGGRMILEIGPTQAVAVSQMMKDAGFEGIRIITDLDRRDRVVLGYYSLNGA